MESVDQPVVVPQKGSLAGDRSEAFEGRSKARAARAGYGRVKKTREIPNRQKASVVVPWGSRVAEAQGARGQEDAAREAPRVAASEGGRAE